MTGSRQEFPGRKIAIPYDQPLAILVALIGVLYQQIVGYRFDGRLEHPARSFTNKLVERAADLEGLPKLDHFRINRFDRSRSRWRPARSRYTVSHGVSSCLVAAKELLPSAGYAAFLHLKRTRLSTISPLRCLSVHRQK